VQAHFLAKRLTAFRWSLAKRLTAFRWNLAKRHTAFRWNLAKRHTAFRWSPSSVSGWFTTIHHTSTRQRKSQINRRSR
jgi:hypothetical protein